MIVKKLKLKNYRNYSDVEIDLQEKLNVFIGNNAQGKTNILESLYVCCHAKSYRCSKDIELIKFGEEHLYIEAILDRNEREEDIKIYINNMKEKNVIINDIKAKKLSELVGYIKVVTFKPEDLLLVKDGPGERRKYLDAEISQIDNYYLTVLQKYNKVLQQKNNYLKNGYNISMEEIDIWNKQLVKYGKKIIKIRQQYIEDINKYIEGIHNNITKGKEKLEIVYNNNVDIDSFEQLLNDTIKDDIRYKCSQIGPHKDDFSFIVNDMDIKKYGSQGQQRTSILSLKFSQIELIEEKTGECPILLLDDVLSELDEERQEKMIGYIDKMQTIITTTEISEDIIKKLNVKKMYYINEGNINIKEKN